MVGYKNCVCLFLLIIVLIGIKSLCPNGWCELSFFEYLLIFDNRNDTSASFSNCKATLFSLFFLQKKEKDDTCMYHLCIPLMCCVGNNNTNAYSCVQQ